MMDATPSTPAANSTRPRRRPDGRVVVRDNRLIGCATAAPAVVADMFGFSTATSRKISTRTVDFHWKLRAMVLTV